MSIDKSIEETKRSLMASGLNDTTKLRHLINLLERSRRDDPSNEIHFEDITIKTDQGGTGYEIGVRNHSRLDGEEEGMIYLDYYNSQDDNYERKSPVLYVWADINNEDHTHRIDLSGTHEDERIEE